MAVIFVGLNVLIHSVNGEEYQLSLPPRWYFSVIYLVKLCINSLSPKRYSCNFKFAILKHILWIDIFSASCTIIFLWTPKKSIDGKSTLI